MNVTMREVRLVDASRRSQRFDHFFVQNRLVRFVQIPSEVDVKRELRRMYDPEFKQSQRGRGALGFSFVLNFVFLLVQKYVFRHVAPSCLIRGQDNGTVSQVFLFHSFAIAHFQ